MDTTEDNNGDPMDIMDDDPGPGMILCAEKLKTYHIRAPKNYKEAMESPHAEQWQEAMTVQAGKLEGKEAWALTNAPQGEPVLQGKWVYDLKSDSDNNVLAFQARWVVCGNHQRPGLDYDDVYFPVVVDVTVKLFITLVAVMKLTWRQFNMITAYLNAELHNDRSTWSNQLGSDKATKYADY